MSRATVIGIKVPGARIMEAKVNDDGTCNLYLEGITNENLEQLSVEVIFKENSNPFQLVEASKLSLKDEFMQYEPETSSGRELKCELENVICAGISNFWCPKYAPSLSGDYGISYGELEPPAVGKEWFWWENTAKKFEPERNSRLGSKEQWIAYCGVRIKTLMKRGFSAKEAWKTVMKAENLHMMLAWDFKIGSFWMTIPNFEDTPAHENLTVLFTRVHASDFSSKVSVGWIVYD